MLVTAGFGDDKQIDVDQFFTWLTNGKVHLVLGNTAARRDEKRHEWTFYVRGATYLVSEVIVKLHPTFKKPVRILRSPPFHIDSVGWGTFDLVVIVKWKVGGEMVADWPLQFDEADRSVAVEVPSDVAAKAFGQAVTALNALLASAAETDSDSGSDEDMSATKVLANQSGEGVQTPVEEAEVPPLPMPELLRDVSAGAKDEAPPRVKICESLSGEPFMQHTHSLFMHGRGYVGPLKTANVTWRSTKPPRKDHDTPEWLTATEFEDDKEVAARKVQQLAILMQLSRKTVVYTGAGISAAVVGQAALSGQNKVGWKAKTEAMPTYTHYALGFLGQQGLIHSWVQQNHDGLPQKAGFPQERINEIHGSWYDPSNPVVKYTGSLHDRAYPWMCEDAETADLVLVLGTSLGGLNADQVATNCAERSLQSAPNSASGEIKRGARVLARPPGKATVFSGIVKAVAPNGSIKVCFPNLDNLTVRLPKGDPVEPQQSTRGSLGTVCFNLQQTPQDGKMTLRLFGKSDDLLKMLIRELGFPKLQCRTLAWPKESRVLVPYDADGHRVVETGRWMWLDLSVGQLIRITPNHNIQGARQPQYMHIGASKPVNYDGQTRQPGIGLGTVTKRDKKTDAFLLEIEGAQMRLGIWWLDAAARGGVEALPIVNQRPSFE
eukprot:TRINITY_DN11057_c0_g1_i1.p1 TRINITY_DN11057_c0_g1~~TRINITY_DN11057_c0_g1_i1.p1  ORF type:complete len:722 (-),score=123.71 TRINITY_DN11057_c0_g1_i1:293-2278(-)